MRNTTEYSNISIEIINLRPILIRLHEIKSIISKKWNFLSIEIDSSEFLKRSHKKIMMIL
jgi:hypothetical protein